MNGTQLKTVEQIRPFLSGTEAVTFSIHAKEDRHAWIESVSIRLKYKISNKSDKGVHRRNLRKTTGYSRQQIIRLIQQLRKTGQLNPRQSRWHRFPGRYTEQNIFLMARTVFRHHTQSGVNPIPLADQALSASIRSIRAI